MIFLSAQPAEPYFLWQLQIQHRNFIESGIDPTTIYALLGHPLETPPVEWVNWAAETPTNILFFRDERQLPAYSPSIRPHIVAKFYEQHPHLQSEWCFYHDSDIVFSAPAGGELINWDMLTATESWKLSDTISYIGYDYIRSKGTDVLLDMCGAVGIPPMVVRRNQAQSGGAQYLLHNTTPAFWQKVERDCESLTTIVNRNSDGYEKQWDDGSRREGLSYHPVQIWCADMWALLWNAWMHGFRTEVRYELRFSWGTNPASDFTKLPIFHNAGVTADLREAHFYKSDYTHRSVFDADHLDVPPITCSWVYSRLIMKEQRERSLPKGILSTVPLVSCVMATKNRRRAVERSIACFLAQTYGRKELIIFNNGDADFELDPALQHQGIRVVNQRISSVTGKPYSEVGEIFRDAFDCSSGDIYIEWDDDDIFLPNHIDAGVKHLLVSGKDAWMPLRSLFSQDSAQSFEYTTNVLEPSVMLRADAVKRHGFHRSNPFNTVNWRYQIEVEQSLVKQPGVHSFCYVWGDGFVHHSANPSDQLSMQDFATGNRDIGFAEEPLKADYMARNHWYSQINHFLDTTPDR